MTGLPFTRDAFLDVFAAYNAAWWPLAIVLWLTTAAALVHAGRRGAAAGAVVASVLTLQWICAGVVYHAWFFTRINPAAWLFAALFLTEAGLLAWRGVRGGLRYVDRRPLRFGAGALIVAYALLYPAIVLLTGGEYPRVPTFGVPCPTTIATIGFLVAADRPIPRTLTIIPIVWAAIGGSAAFLLGVPADLMLLASGVVLLVDALTPRGALVVAPLREHHR
jgi:hypothetical protein